MEPPKVNLAGLDPRFMRNREVNRIGDEAFGVGVVMERHGLRLVRARRQHHLWPQDDTAKPSRAVGVLLEKPLGGSNRELGGEWAVGYCPPCDERSVSQKLIDDTPRPFHPLL